MNRIRVSFVLSAVLLWAVGPTQPNAEAQEVPVAETAAPAEVAAPAEPTSPFDNPDPAKATERVQNNARSLEALLRSLQSKREDITETQERLKNAPDEITRNQRLEELRTLKGEEAELNDQFVRFAVGVDTSLFTDEPETKFDWQQEVGALVKPILAEFKNATAKTRAIGELRAEIDDLHEVHSVAEEAVRNIEMLAAAERTPELTSRLIQELEEWRQRRDDAHNQLTGLQIQLDARLAEKQSFLDASTAYARDFFRTRGLNLVFGAAAFCAVFFGLRLLSFLMRKLRPAKEDRSFTSRLGALLFQLSSVLGGLAATLLVFNMVGDWFLLGIIIIFLIGIAWASAKALPQYIEIVKLMLNVGAVKEQERLLFDGAPWRVADLGLTARLENPLLDGGLLVLPIKYLVGYHSRPNGAKEEWFPCRAGDWVQLSDGKMGRVAYQTPSAVQVTELGGSQVVYQTPDFLALSPRTLSTGFRITTTFGVDYKHQVISTSEIPEKMKAMLEAGLGEVAGAGNVKRVAVEFTEAGASSLDYAIDVDLAADAAPRYPSIVRAISRVLVDACNENNWVIPFQQITLHQAG